MIIGSIGRIALGLNPNPREFLSGQVVFEFPCVPKGLRQYIRAKRAVENWRSKGL